MSEHRSQNQHVTMQEGADEGIDAVPRPATDLCRLRGAEGALEAGVQDGVGAEIGEQVGSSPDALRKAAGWTSLDIHPRPWP